MRRFSYFCVFLPAVAGFFGWAGVSRAAILFQDNFDSYGDSPQNHGWNIPSAASTENGDSPDGGRVLKFMIENRGTSQYWSSFDPNPRGGFSDGYIGFWAKAEGHTNGATGGVKWLKLFSADYGGSLPSYANVTFGQGYGSGQFYEISTGVGYGAQNDTQAGYRYNGFVSSGAWTSGASYSAGYLAGYGTNSIYTAKLGHIASADNRPGVGPNWPAYWDRVGIVASSSAPFYPGAGWHYYQYYVKHNTDNNFDGEFAVWRDGELKIRVTAMRNRNNSNSEDWSSASLVNHAESAPPAPYSIYFDGITVSDSYINYSGNGDTEAPAAPSGLVVQ